MLQQTRAVVVVAYYERFMARFPDLATLADALLDDVLGLWTGLGYYSRARNLHRAATVVRDRHRGVMPRDLDRLVAPSGDRPLDCRRESSALSHGDRHPILDGNVKRVLCRYQRHPRLARGRAGSSELCGRSPSGTPRASMLPRIRRRSWTSAQPLRAVAPTVLHVSDRGRLRRPTRGRSGEASRASAPACGAAP